MIILIYQYIFRRIKMTYEEVLKKAREVMLPQCRVCPECNGLACKGEIPGMGGIHSGNSFTITRDFFKSVKVLMDVIYEPGEVDTSIELFGQKFDQPFFLAPIGGMNLNYNGYFVENEYIEIIIKAMKEVGSIAFTPDGLNDQGFSDYMKLVEKYDGFAVPTVKPWEKELLMNKLLAVRDAGAKAVACDVDSCGNLNLKRAGKPVYPISQNGLQEIVNRVKIPFIVKGVMTAKAALACADAGCYGIVVSTHGGRVIEDAPAPASMLEEIKAAVGDRIKIFVDGGIRSGYDVFKCLALGADAVLIGRPYVIATHGGREEGMKLYTEKILSELRDVMVMTGSKTLSDITRDKIKLIK